MREGDLMRLAKTLTMLLVCGGLVVGAGVAKAGWSSSGALLDIYSYFYDTTKNNENWNTAWVEQYGAWNTASGTGYNYDSLGWVAIEWDLYEPNKVNRSSNNGQIGQKEYVWMQARTQTGEASSWYTSNIIEKCKADTKVNVKKDGSLSNATWNVNCKPQEGEITISEVRALRLQQLLGKNVIKNNGVAIKGKCKSDDCRVQD